MTNMLKKVFNWSEVHLSEVTSYKIHTLIATRLSNSPAFLLPRGLGESEEFIKNVWNENLEVYHLHLGKKMKKHLKNQSIENGVGIKQLGYFVKFCSLLRKPAT